MCIRDRTKELKSSLDTIRKTAAEMIEGIDAKLKVLLAEKAPSAEMEMCIRDSAYSHRNHEQPRMGQHRHELSERLVRSGISGLSHHRCV